MEKCNTTALNPMRQSPFLKNAHLWEQPAPPLWSFTCTAGEKHSSCGSECTCVRQHVLLTKEVGNRYVITETEGCASHALNRPRKMKQIVLFF